MLRFRRGRRKLGFWFCWLIGLGLDDRISMPSCQPTHNWYPCYNCKGIPPHSLAKNTSKPHGPLDMTHHVHPFCSRLGWKKTLQGWASFVPSTTMPLVELVWKDSRWWPKKWKLPVFLHWRWSWGEVRVESIQTSWTMLVGSDDAQMTIEVKNNSLHTYILRWLEDKVFSSYFFYTDSQAEFRL